MHFISTGADAVELCRQTCKHGFEIVGRGGHHGAVDRKSFVSISCHQCDVTEQAFYPQLVESLRSTSRQRGYM